MRAAAAFAALTVSFGILAHLVAELAGLGWHDDGAVLLSSRHAYLAALGAIALGGLAWCVRKIEPASRRTAAAELVAALPFAGRGARFVALSFACQFAFFAASQLGEGCPLCGGDVLVGVVAAAFAPAIGALAVTCLQRRLVALAVALAWLVFSPAPARALRVIAVESLSRIAARHRTLLMYQPSRPPPAPAALD